MSTCARGRVSPPSRNSAPLWIDSLQGKMYKNSIDKIAGEGAGVAAFQELRPSLD